MELRTKIILGVIMATIIGLILYFIMKPSEEGFFNEITLPTNTYIRNRTGQTYLDTIVSVGIAELNLYPKVVSIEFFDPSMINTDDDMEYQAHIIGENGQYIIYVVDMSRSKAIQVLSHELIHLEQMELGKIVVNREENTITWKGVEYTEHTVPDYSVREWEIDAERRSSSLRKVIKSILYE